MCQYANWHGEVLIMFIVFFVVQYYKVFYGILDRLDNLVSIRNTMSCPWLTSRAIQYFCGRVWYWFWFWLAQLLEDTLFWFVHKVFDRFQGQERRIIISLWEFFKVQVPWWINRPKEIQYLECWCPHLSFRWVFGNKWNYLNNALWIQPQAEGLRPESSFSTHDYYSWFKRKIYLVYKTFFILGSYF